MANEDLVEWVERCEYCGTETHKPCCGEVHRVLVPECPACRGQVYEISTGYQGIETSYWACDDCPWESQPE